MCAPCWHRLPSVPPPHCVRCGATATRHFGNQACGECEGWPSELRAAAPYRMEREAASLVRGLKYGGWKAVAEPMGQALESPGRRLAMDTEPVLVAVPLAEARLRERGFNQSELLARALGEVTGWKVLDVLQRRRSGRHQARLGRSGRLRNVRHIFAVRAGANALESPVLLVDDVVTTGATAAACHRVLTEAGLRCVGVVSFARAVHPIGGD